MIRAALPITNNQGSTDHLGAMLISIGIVLFILLLAIRSLGRCPHRGKCRYCCPESINCNNYFDRCGAYKDWETRKDAWKEQLN